VLRAPLFIMHKTINRKEVREKVRKEVRVKYAVRG
jgi:hypothetical protein